MSSLTEHQREHACRIFLASADGVEAKRRIDQLTEHDAARMETDLVSLRIARTLDEIAAFAHAQRVDSTELLFSLASEDVGEFVRLCEGAGINVCA